MSQIPLTHGQKVDIYGGAFPFAGIPPTPPATVPLSQVKPQFDPRAMGTPNRGTSEGSLDEWNRAMRSSDVYLNFMRRNGLPTDGRVKLSRGQQAALERELAAAGFNVPGGMHIDQGGNLNQKNRLGRNVAIAAGATGAALTGFGLAGMGPLGGVLGGAGAGAGAAGAGASGAAGAGAAAGGGAASGIGTTAGYSSLFGGTGAFLPTSGAAAGAGAGAGVGAAVGAGAGAAGGLFRFSDLARYGIPAATSLFTGYMGNRASANANQLSTDESRRQFDLTQQFLRDQEAQRHQEWLDTEASKKAQWDAEQTEKRRKWDYGEPWREASRGALTRMTDLMDRGPERVAYQPTFYYKP